MRVVSYKTETRKMNGWLKDRFGDHFAQISTDTTLKLRSSVKDTARVLLGNVPWEIEELSKKFINAPQGVTDSDHVFGYDNDEGFVQGSIEYDLALREYIAKYPEHFKIVKKLLGLVRNKSSHASAYALANRPLQEIIPTVNLNGVRVTQYTAGSVEKTGVIKNDLLVVNSLNDIAEAIKLAQSLHNGLIPKELEVNGVIVPGTRLVPFKETFYDIWDLPEELEVFAEIVAGRTETVFQYGTKGAQEWLEYFRGNKPDRTPVLSSIKEMAVFTALDRPGALDAFVEVDGQEHNMLVEYTRRAKGMKWAETPRVFTELLKETYGCLVFQEDVQQLYQEIVGCTRAEAEKFRSDVAKKKKREVEKAYPVFIKAATEKYGIEEAQSAWDAIQTFSRYGFPKSHAAAYAVTGYACAFLKYYYPLEWWCAVLSNAEKSEIHEKFWRFCGHLVDLPDIKYSKSNFAIANGRIKAPLSFLNGIGDKAHDQLCRYMPYKDVQDFCVKIQKHREVDMVVTEEIVEKTDRKTKEIIKTKKIKKKYGRSALTRGCVYTLIVSGVMDSLFPEGSSIVEKLSIYEEELAKATEAKKVEKVPDDYLKIDDLSKHQIRKEIMPAYTVELLPLLLNRADFERTANGSIYKFGHDRYKVLTNTQINHIMGLSSLPKFGISGAIPCFIISTRNFSYQGGSKTACALTIDVEGDRYELVKWPDRDGKLSDEFNSKLEGTIAMIVVKKWAIEKPFAIEFIQVLLPKIKLSKKESIDE